MSAQGLPTSPGLGTARAVPIAVPPCPFRASSTSSSSARRINSNLMLGMLKILAYAYDLQVPDLPTWLPRARALIAKAEAILAGEPDPDPDPAGATGSAYIVRELAVSRVREQVVAILETDPDITPLSADAVTDLEIYHACSAVVAEMNLDEQVGAAAFRAGFLAIRAADRRLTCEDGGGSEDA